jgi:polyphosphate glucokinase
VPGDVRPASVLGMSTARQITHGLGFGVDIGGTGIKGAPVDFATGNFAQERVRTPTPRPSTPEAVADAVGGIVAEFGRASGRRPIGITFPAVIQHGVARTAVNVDPSWVGSDVDAVMTERLGRTVHVINDADAAGFAEVRYGAARGVRGVVLLATLGTGIGTALLVDGVLVPNTELGHIEVDGQDAETTAAASVRERQSLGWQAWAERLQRYFRAVEDLVWPDLIVVGGGVSKRSEKFLPLLDLRTPIVPATLRNRAGVIGAALLAAEHG